MRRALTYLSAIAFQLSATFATAVALLLFQPASSASQSTRDYAHVLEDYCAQKDGVINEVAQWDSSQIDAAAEIARSYAAEQRLVAAALHLQAYANLWREERGSISSSHGDLSRTLAASARNTSAGALVKQWTLAWGYFQLGHLMLNDASRHFAQARATFPDDPDLITASGIVHELTGHPLGQQTIRGTNTSFDSVRRQRAMALSLYQLALKHSPDHEEAMLRIGRLHFLNGDLRNSMAALSRVKDRTADPRTRYLAHLFLGQAKEAAGDLDEALGEYDSASASVPGAWTAIVSRFAIRSLLDGAAVDQAPVPSAPDPWNEYLFTQPYRFASVLDALRRASCVSR